MNFSHIPKFENLGCDRFGRLRDPYTYFIDMKYYEIRLSSSNSAYINDIMNYRENIT
jgi:hypothetical protein